MNLIFFLSLVLTIYGINGAIEKENCFEYLLSSCSSLRKYEDNSRCNSKISGFDYVLNNLQAYALNQINQSYVMLQISSNFGTAIKNRPGFQKLFMELSDKAFYDSIHIIKHLTLRGGQMNFSSYTAEIPFKLSRVHVDLNELVSLGYVLDIQKYLTLQAHQLHEQISHSNNKNHYDPEIAHFIENELIKEQAKIIRKLSGYITDLLKLLSTSDSSLSLKIFDDFLQKQ